MQTGRSGMSDKKPMLLVLAGPKGSGKSTISFYWGKARSDIWNGFVFEVQTENIREGKIWGILYKMHFLHVYDNTEEPVRIIRKHKDDISIYPNVLWPEERILELIEETNWYRLNICIQVSDIL